MIRSRFRWTTPRPHRLDERSRGKRALRLESLEPRTLLAVQPVNLADPSTYGLSGSFASSVPSISADGQLVAFVSNADDLVPNDGNGKPDAFVFDRGSGVVTLVSVGVDGDAAGIGGYTSPMAPLISPDGRLVVFENTQGNVLAGIGGDQLYLRDLTTATTSLLSVAPDGRTAGNGGSREAVFSADGRNVVFLSDAGNLVGGIDFTGRFDRPNVFKRDLVQKTTSLVSLSLDGKSGGDFDSGPAAVSADGRFVVFQSSATNLVPQDNQDIEQVYVRDTVAGTTTLVSVDVTGQAGGGGHNTLNASPQVISADGRYVVFNSNASNLVAPPIGGRNIFLRDLRNGSTLLVSASAVDGTSVGGGGTELISPDGRWVAFATATQATSIPTNGKTNVYVQDLTTGTLSLASINAAGTAGGNDGSGLGTFYDFPGGLSFSPDGRAIAFRSKATDLTPGVVTGNRNLFVRNLDAGVTRLVTPNLAGTDGGAGDADIVGAAAFSADGRVIAFESTAGDLVLGDNNRVNDVFVRDLSAGSTALASPRSPLFPTERLMSRGADLSDVTPDGRYVVMGALGSPDVVPGVNVDAFSYHVFLRDRQTGATRVVDVRLDGLSAPENAFGASVTPDGRYVVFLGQGTTLVAGLKYYAAFRETMAYRRDMQTGTTQIVSVNPAGDHSVNVVGGEVVVSDDGRYVAYTSSDVSAVSGLTKSGDFRAVFLRDMQTNTTVLVSRNLAGNGQINGNSTDISISADGRYVVFNSTAPDLAPGDANAKSDVFRFDRTTGQVQLVSVRRTGDGAGDGQSGDADYYRPVMTPDGRFVLFGSFARDLVSNDANGQWDVFVRDMTNGTTQLASIDTTGQAGNANSALGSLSSDGRYAVFVSNASDLVAGDANGKSDVFARDLQTGTTTLVSVNAAGTGSGNGAVSLRPDGPYTATTRPAISADGRFVAFRSDASDLAAGITYTPGFANLFVRDLAANTTKLITANSAGTATPSGHAGGGRIFLATSGGGTVIFDTGTTFSPQATDLFPGDDNLAVDVFAAAIPGRSTISGRVYHDRNGNGAFDSGETGLAGWTVYIDSNGNGARDVGEDLAVSDAAGGYALRGLTPGTYAVAIKPQAGYGRTAPAGSDTRVVTIANDGDTVAGQDYGQARLIPDLAASGVSVSPTVTGPGQPLTVSWTISNLGSGPATGNWVDSVYLSTTPTLGPDALRVAAIPNPGPIAAGATYSTSQTVNLPAIPPGTYYVIVQSDSRNQIHEGPFGANRSNNLATAPSTVNLTIPTLVAGTSIQDRFTAAGQGRYYRIDVAPGQTLRLALDSAAGSGAQELYVRRGSLPNPTEFDFAAREFGQADQSLDIPMTAGGTYYVFVRTLHGAATTESFSLRASLPVFEASATGLVSGGNTGRVTIPISGSLLTEKTLATLVSSTTTIPAVAMFFQDASRVFATFDLAGKPLGSYDIRLDDGGRSTTLAGGFSVVPGVAGTMQVTLGVANEVRAGGLGSVTVRYVNTSNVDALAPLIAVSADHALFYLPDSEALKVSTITILGIAPDGPAGVLRPGASGEVTIPLRSTAATGQDIHYSTVIADPIRSMDWASSKNAMRMDHIPPDAWDAIYSNFLANIGGTVGSYQNAIAADATYLSGLGIRTPNVARLVAYEFNKASGAFTAQTLATVVDANQDAPGVPLTFVRQFEQSLEGRFRVGPFGRGWTHNWQIEAEVDDAGNVEVHAGGATRFFARRPGGAYEGAPTDQAVLTRVNGGYQLVEANGAALAFNADGSLNYLRDPNGNRVTASYTAGRLTKLTHSNGRFLTIDYDARGLIDRITDPAGRICTYGYDASGEFLTDFTDKYGTTRYSYLTGQANPALNNALTQIAYADDTHINYRYDSQGRLVEQSRDDGQEAISYSHAAAGGYTITDAVGGSSIHRFDDSGRIVETVDPLGRTTRRRYDARGNLTTVEGPLGASLTFTHDAQGNRLSATDALGNVTQFGYDDSRRLIRVTDARGNSTQYGRDGQGNLLSITYADGNGQRFQYDPLGNLVQTTNGRGQVLRQDRDAAGRVVKKTYADNSTATFSYDAHGNLIQAKDQSGGLTTMTYDAADNLLRINYPDGRFLRFTYNLVGQRTQSLDDTGFTLNHVHDALGRLSALRDGNGGLIVRYTYDAAGRLVEKALGNGTYTNYAYDAAGYVLSIVNRAPRPAPGQDGPVNSRFDYEYDALGRATAESTLDGRWVYTHDLAGQLTRAVFTPANGSTLPARDLQYAYDAAGNRTRTVIDGVTTLYAANSVNQYTQVGGTSYTYDKDGNLASATTGGLTTSYTFNQEDQLVGIAGAGGSWSHRYDPFGNRVATTHDGATTTNLIDPIGLGNVAAQFDGSGNLIAHYTHGLGLVSRVSGTGASGYYDFDRTGDTAGITDSAGAYVNRYRYLPFGQSTTQSAGLSNPFTFVGLFGVTADGSGLISMRAREYDPALGTFLSNDPLGLLGGDVNLRRYVGNDPVGRVDPGGLIPFDQAQEGAVYNWLKGPYKPYYYVILKCGRVIITPQGTTIGDVNDPAGDHYTLITYPNGDQYLLKGFSDVYTNNPPPTSGKGKGDPPNAAGPSGGDPGCDCGCPPAQPPTPPGPAGPRGRSGSPGGFDPNEIIGPAGIGPWGALTGREVFPYTVAFENDPTRASLAAQNVTISLALDPDLDWSTFQLGDFQFGAITVVVPGGFRSYSTIVSARNVDGTPLLVAIDAELNALSGVVTWSFISLDPVTNQSPLSAVAGFLPVNDAGGRGQGYVHFTVRPRSAPANGTTITAQASVMFDANAPIVTNTAINTIDLAPPTSSVHPLLSSSNATSFLVNWSGQDGQGAGVVSYDVHVSIDGGPFTPFQTGTSSTSAMFTGQVGHSYGFYSVAIDALGNVEARPTTAQASTRVEPPPVRIIGGAVQRVTIKSGRSRRTVTALVLSFSGPLNPNSAKSLVAYRLARAGRDRKFGTRDDQVVRLQSALHDPGRNTVALIPQGGTLSLSPALQLQVIGSSLADTTGRPIDGDGDGRVGGNLRAQVTRNGLTAAGVASLGHRVSAAAENGQFITFARSSARPMTSLDGKRSPN